MPGKTHGEQHPKPTTHDPRPNTPATEAARAALTDHPTDATLVAKDRTTGDARLNERCKADYYFRVALMNGGGKNTGSEEKSLWEMEKGGQESVQPCLVNCSTTNRSAQYGCTKFKNLTVWQPLGLKLTVGSAVGRQVGRQKI